MYENNLFIISYEIDSLENVNDIVCGGIYTDLEVAKNELKNIYNKTPDYKHFGYKILLYTLVENKYKFTNRIYTYKFNEFRLDTIIL